MNENSNNPFKWKDNKEPSIFYKDQHFRAKGESGRTTGQIVSEYVERQRAEGKSPGTIKNLGKSKEKEVLAYRQFGTNERVKHRNKHQQ